jgi:hypothetical protein
VVGITEGGPVTRDIVDQYPHLRQILLVLIFGYRYFVAVLAQHVVGELER